MSDVHFFQRYHNKENTHSANACLLLSRLYAYNNKLFYNVLSSLFEIDYQDLSTRFVLQDKKKRNESIPDFSISQPSFKLVVEAKEKDNKSIFEQLENHAKGLDREPAKYKFLVLLAPSLGPNDDSNIERIEKGYKDIFVLPVRYIDLYEKIKEVLVEIRDDDMIAILEDYYDYCQEENLIDESGETIMVRLSGRTIEHNVKHNLYYDGNRSKWSGFSYIGLYTKKSVKYVGKITSVFNVFGPVPTIERLDSEKEVSIEEKERIEKSFKESFGSDCNGSYTYYLVDRFSEVRDFNKKSPRALYGKKKFYLSKYGLKDGASSDEVAAALSNNDWE